MKAAAESGGHGPVNGNHGKNIIKTLITKNIVKEKQEVKNRKCWPLPGPAGFLISSPSKGSTGSAD